MALFRKESLSERHVSISAIRAMVEPVVFPDVHSIVRSIESMDSPEEQRFARAVGPVMRSLDRIAEHEARLRARLAVDSRPGASVGDLPDHDRPAEGQSYVAPPGAGVGPTPATTPGEHSQDIAMPNMTAMAASQDASRTPMQIPQAAMEFQMQVLNDTF